MAAITSLLSKDDLVQLSSHELTLLEAVVCGAIASNSEIKAVLKRELHDALDRIKAQRGGK